MTTLYRPVRIETAAQAEALPIGTFAHVSCGQHRDKIGPDEWEDSNQSFDDAEMVGGEAFVPIEAEEEWKTLHEGSWHLKADEDDARRDANSLGARRRYTTDWEEA